ncbi:hypothetical protein OH76DRAFT_1490237 [Lentinus brumalis]|uniref:Uncharacterized protein n=1 Tax=Lentinus brumalis TaxID=2498619 RepID=A0A371CJN8_9APHY|nr:hypothetical protein OH76DRAFT_1490237 [Polyporus brumalis]
MSTSVADKPTMPQISPTDAIAYIRELEGEIRAAIDAAKKELEQFLLPDGAQLQVHLLKRAVEDRLRKVNTDYRLGARTDLRRDAASFRRRTISSLPKHLIELSSQYQGSKERVDAVKKLYEGVAGTLAVDTRAQLEHQISDLQISLESMHELLQTVTSVHNSYGDALRIMALDKADFNAAIFSLSRQPALANMLRSSSPHVDIIREACLHWDYALKRASAMSALGIDMFELCKYLDIDVTQELLDAAASGLRELRESVGAQAAQSHAALRDLKVKAETFRVPRLLKSAKEFLHGRTVEVGKMLVCRVKFLRTLGAISAARDDHTLFFTLLWETEKVLAPLSGVDS